MHNNNNILCCVCTSCGLMALSTCGIMGCKLPTLCRKTMAKKKKNILRMMCHYGRLVSVNLHSPDLYLKTSCVIECFTAHTWPKTLLCISVEMYNNNLNALLNKQQPVKSLIISDIESI